jgi:hypothetical protein
MFYAQKMYRYLSKKGSENISKFMNKQATSQSSHFSNLFVQNNTHITFTCSNIVEIWPPKIFGPSISHNFLVKQYNF